MNRLEFALLMIALAQLFLCFVIGMIYARVKIICRLLNIEKRGCQKISYELLGINETLEEE